MLAMAREINPECDVRCSDTGRARRTGSAHAMRLACGPATCHAHWRRSPDCCSPAVNVKNPEACRPVAYASECGSLQRRKIWRCSRWPPRPRWLVKRLATTGPRSGSSGSFNDCSPGAALTTVNPTCAFASGTPRHRALPPPASRWTATSTEGNDDVAAGDCGRLWESRRHRKIFA